MLTRTQPLMLMTRTHKCAHKSPTVEPTQHKFSRPWLPTPSQKEGLRSRLHAAIRDIQSVRISVCVAKSGFEVATRCSHQGTSKACELVCVCVCVVVCGYGVSLFFPFLDSLFFFLSLSLSLLSVYVLLLSLSVLCVVCCVSEWVSECVCVCVCVCVYWWKLSSKARKRINNQKKKLQIRKIDEEHTTLRQ